MSLRQLQSVARVLATVVAAGAAATALVIATASGLYALAVAVLASLLVRVVGPSERVRGIGAIGLVVAVAGVVGASGGLGGPLLLTLLLVVADYGMLRSARLVALVGLGAGVACAGTALLVVPDTVDGFAWLWSLALLPLVGVTARQLGGRQSLDGTAALESASAALDEVLALAERIPAGLDRWSVASAVHLEVLEASRLAGREGPTSHLLLVQHGVLFGVGGAIARQPVGLLDDLPRQRLGSVWTRVDGDDLPEPFRTSVGGTRWYLHRLGGNGDHGVVLVPSDAAPVALDEIRDVLQPAAVALGNVERFEQLEDLAFSTVRTRLAHDLHDGVAQALTHVRFELDLLALEDETIAGEIARIREVADAALLDVRHTVGELRDAASLADRIRRHVALLGSFALATIELDLPARLEVPDPAAAQVFRIVQEALSNAVRHADAATIRVVLVQDDHGLTIAVVDDGVGVPDRRRRGIGVGGMEARARRLGGELRIRPRRGGGTVVEVEAPLATPTVTGMGGSVLAGPGTS